MLKSAVYGFAVGDALGVPFEFKARGTFNCEGMTGFGMWNQPVGTWSDDTSMVLATCDSIGKNGGKINLEDIADRFVRWRYDGAYTCNGDVFDIGGTTMVALRKYKTFRDVQTCGLGDKHNNGNGGLMRILPVVFAQDVNADVIRDVCKITHATQLSALACEIYCDALAMIEKHKELTDFDLVFYSTFGSEFYRLANLTEIPESEIKSTGYVLDSLEAALWCFVTTDNYKDCVLKAVNLGGDTDTIAALAGGLAGAKYGMEGIPAEWLEQLRNKELIEECLYETE